MWLIKIKYSEVDPQLTNSDTFWHTDTQFRHKLKTLNSKMVGQEKSIHYQLQTPKWTKMK